MQQAGFVVMQLKLNFLTLSHLSAHMINLHKDMQKQRCRSADRHPCFFRYRQFLSLLWLYSPVCVGPSRKPEVRFSHDAALNMNLYYDCKLKNDATVA